MRIYPNAAHTFFNDTTPMYNEAVATDAWERVLRYYKEGTGRCLSYVDT
jgi:dienelactone hydrolase